jgi:murein DD-endopeptidase MepM/ murein hydrolase activator NlpD
MEVRATASGTVVKTVADQPDDGSFDPAASLKDLNALCGNYVVIDQGGVFALFAHLKRDSIKVVAGDRVRRGDVIAAIGNSGSSLFPHLHFQLMDAADMRGEGVPVLFRDFTRRYAGTRRSVRAGNVDSGEEIDAR